MRYILIVLGLCCMAPLAGAQEPVFEVAKGSAIVSNVLVNTTAVQLDISTRTFLDINGKPIGERFILEIYNDDSSSSGWCAFNASVSTHTNGTAYQNYGRRVSPRSAWTIAVPKSVKVYCKTDSTSGIRLLMTQLW